MSASRASWRGSRAAAALGLLTYVVGCAGAPVDAVGEPLRLRVRVLAEYPHAADAFTQGLVWHEGVLYESTGQWGESSLRRVEPASGRVLSRVDLAADRFGEGLARVGDRLLQLTWQAGEALVWDLESFAPLGVERYEGEGWGLCFDGSRLVRSDGSAMLTLHEVEDFRVAGTLQVTLAGGRVPRLNELECAEGWIYANVWQTDWIVRIDPGSGEVVAVIDASELLPPAERSAAGVLNGIAYNAENGSFLLTGKNWPRLYEVVFVSAEGR